MDSQVSGMAIKSWVPAVLLPVHNTRVQRRHGGGWPGEGKAVSRVLQSSPCLTAGMTYVATPLLWVSLNTGITHALVHVVHQVLALVFLRCTQALVIVVVAIFPLILRHRLQLVQAVDLVVVVVLHGLRSSEQK